MDLVELVSAVEEKFGVSAAAVAAPAVAAGAGGGAEAAAEEQTSFDVVLTSGGDKKVAVIKIVRSLTTLGLKEAKDLVDGAPKTLKDDVTKDEAEAIVKQVVEAGGTAEIK